MTRRTVKLTVAVTLLAAGIVFELPMLVSFTSLQTSEAEAIIGRPATPVSYAGVARRTTVRIVQPGINRGGPVNRIGVR